MIRLVDDSAGIMNGGLAQVGSVAVTCATRSATSWRARSSSVPVLEDERDRRTAGRPTWSASRSSPSMPAELVLDRDRDELLDLVGGVAEGDRLDLDLRRGELREDVDLGLRQV